ncbi:unnamed protein product, partial [Ilex paraguariensis]
KRPRVELWQSLGEAFSAMLGSTLGGDARQGSGTEVSDAGGRGNADKVLSCAKGRDDADWALGCMGDTCASAMGDASVPAMGYISVPTMGDVRSKASSASFLRVRSSVGMTTGDIFDKRSLIGRMPNAHRVPSSEKSKQRTWFC